MADEKKTESTGRDKYFGGFLDALFVLFGMGFAILGAGVSGVCPILLGTKWVGFR